MADSEFKDASRQKTEEDALRATVPPLFHPLLRLRRLIKSRIARMPSGTRPITAANAMMILVTVLSHRPTLG